MIFFFGESVSFADIGRGSALGKDGIDCIMRIMRIAIEQNVSFIATPNPSTILRLVTIADQNREQIIRDINDGTIAGEFDIEAGIRREINTTIKPNVRRARELEAMLRSDELFAPRYYWPNLKLVGCWKGGSVGSTPSITTRS